MKNGKESTRKMIYFINLFILLVLTFSVAAFVVYGEIESPGSFFRLFIIIGAGAIFLFNMIYFYISAKNKKKTSNSYLFSALLYPLTALAIAFSGGYFSEPLRDYIASPEVSSFLAYKVLGMTVSSLIVSASVFVLMLFVLRIFKFIVIKRLKAFSAKTKTEYDDMVVDIIDNAGWPFYVLVSMYISMLFLDIPAQTMRWINYAAMIILTFYIVKTMMRITDHAKKEVIKRRKGEGTSIIEFMSKLIKGIIWVIAFLVILQNIGFNITSLIAGLGIGGVAIALALQNVLTDLFSSISIYFDKPFKEDDFIIVGENMGFVKKIGIKTTRIESLWGQEVIISNRELTSTRINNYKQMKRRRIHFKIGVTYETSPKKLRKIDDIVRQIFESIKNADLDRVHFKEFGDFSLNYEIAYYINSPDYNEYMDIQQDINLALVERFNKEGIDFAYPTSTIILQKQDKM